MYAILNRAGFALLLCCRLALIPVEGLSQPFSFANAHPVNNRLVTTQCQSSVIYRPLTTEQPAAMLSQKELQG